MLTLLWVFPSPASNAFSVGKWSEFMSESPTLWVPVLHFFMHCYLLLTSATIEVLKQSGVDGLLVEFDTRLQ